ncbi:MAG: hypothetical protein ACK57B_15055 [Betaproteobacteria bacterium]
MDRIDARRLWPQTRLLLSAPPPPDDPELRRAARLLAASRSDVVELLLARWLADTAAAQTAPAEPQTEPAPATMEPPSARRASLRRDAALVGSGLVAGVVGTALLGGLLDDDAGDAF